MTTKKILEVLLGINADAPRSSKIAAAANYGWVLPVLGWIHTHGNDVIHVDFVLTVWGMTFIAIALFFIIDLVRRLLVALLQVRGAGSSTSTTGEPKP